MMLLLPFSWPGPLLLPSSLLGLLLNLPSLLRALLLWSSLVFEGFLIESLAQALVGDSWGVELVKSNVYNRQTL